MRTITLCFDKANRIYVCCFIGLHNKAFKGIIKRPFKKILGGSMWFHRLESVEFNELISFNKYNDGFGRFIFEPLMLYPRKIYNLLEEIFLENLENREKLSAFLHAEYGICCFYQYWDSLETIRKTVIKDYGLMILRKLFVKKVEQKQPANLIPIKQNNQEIFNVRPIIRLMLLTARFNTPLYNHQELYHG